jgi:hypothetical protein
MDVYGVSGGLAEGGAEEKRILRGEEDGSMLHIYM